MKKKLPKFKNDKELIDFVDNNDLGDYLSSEDLKPMTFELKPKNANLHLRISTDLLNNIKKKAKKEKINYQKYIRLILSKNVA